MTKDEIPKHEMTKDEIPKHEGSTNDGNRTFQQTLSAMDFVIISCFELRHSFGLGYFGLRAFEVVERGQMSGKW